MKIRHGFVSNSSSASFIVDWTIENDKDYKKITPGLLALYLSDNYNFRNAAWDKEPENYDRQKDEPIWNKCFINSKEDRELFDEVKANTKIRDITADHIKARTIFWTSMNNEDYSSFGNAARNMIMQLVVNDTPFTTKIEAD